MSTSIPEGAVWQWKDHGIFYRRVDDRYEVWIPADPRWQDTLLLSDWLDSEDAKAKGITRIATPDDGWRYPPELPPEPMLCEVEWELTPIIGRPSISYWTGQIFRGCTHRAVAEQSPTLPHGGDMGDVLRWRPLDRTEQATTVCAEQAPESATTWDSKQTEVSTPDSAHPFATAAYSTEQAAGRAAEQWIAKYDFLSLTNGSTECAPKTRIRPSDRAGIDSFVPPPERKAEPVVTPRVSTWRREWRWLP